MGDRGQIVVLSEHGPGAVFLYTHDGGNRLQRAVADGIARGRWDGEYLTRCIFSELTAGHEGKALGYGIGLQMHGDLNRPLIVVDPNTGRVAERPVNVDRPTAPVTPSEGWSLENYRDLHRTVEVPA